MGAGRHTLAIDPLGYPSAGKVTSAIVIDSLTPKVSNAFQWWYFTELGYVLSTALIKFCIGALLLRICAKRYQFIIIWVVIAVVAVFSIFYFFLLVFQCSPISFFWTQFQGVPGTCLPVAVTTNATYVHSAVSALADWTLCVLPIFVVKDLKMNPRTKVTVALLLGIGAL
jgi:hypothetical protein